MRHETVLTNARLPGGRAGDLVLPGLTDGHMHLDKTLFSRPGGRTRPSPAA
jgi:cytosine/adenosine deaminase-related metal-dependent hydrolase